MKSFFKNIIYLIVLLFFAGNVISQTTEDIKKEADGFFKKEQFVEATPLYLQLLNVEPRNHELNFKYGTCLIYSAQDKSESIRFLNFSVKNASIDPRAHFYLGKAYHLNFQFSKALTAYQKFKQVANQNDQIKFNVEANINACQNGKQLLTNITDMIVLDKVEVKKQDFYELYKLNDIGGSLLITDEFQTKIDKKLGHRPIIYFPQDSPYIFYSSYGESGDSGLDIYVKQKLPNGKWSNAVKVVGDVNTNEDEDYPYLSPDGKYLYYSSKGHNSMGGYDVFRSKVIVEGSSFSKPENMDFAVSSPNDDILYIVDSLDRTAYFSSARESQDGKLYVYKVRVEKIPMQLVVLKGFFSNTIDPSNKNVEIEVANFTTGATVGKYNSTPGNGSVLLTIPKSGKYTFDMTVKGSEITHRAEVSIPYMKEFRPLKIDLAHQLKNGQEVIILKTLFDDKFDDPTAIMADVYQRISKLDPNSNRYDLDSLDNMRSSDDVFVSVGLDKYATPQDVEEILVKAVNQVKIEKDNLENSSFLSHNIAVVKQSQANAKLEEAKVLISEVEGIDDEAVKNKKLTKAYKLNAESKELNNEARNLVNLGQKIENEIKVKENEEITLNSSILSVKAVDQNDGEGLTQFVKSNSDALILATDNNKTDIISRVKSEGASKAIELSGIEEKIGDLKDREMTLDKKILDLKEQKVLTKKKKEVEVIETKIQSAESERDLIQSEITKYKGKLDRFSDNDMTSIALVKAVEEIRSDKNVTPENQEPVSNTEKLKIKYSVDDQEYLTSVKEAEIVFKNNSISGESINLTGLNESTVLSSDFKSLSDVEEGISNTMTQLENSDNEAERLRLQKDLAKLNQIKEQKLKEKPLVSNNISISKPDLIENYNERVSDILAINDVEKQKEAQAKLNKELKSKVEKAIAVAKEKDNKDTEIAQLKKIQTEVNRDLSDYESWKVAKSNQENFADYTYQDALNEVSLNYESRIEEIYNSSDSDESKTEELKTLNTTVLTNAKEKLQESEAILSENPSNALAEKEKRQLTRLISELETNLAIPLVEPKEKSNIASNEEPITANDLLPNYSENINKIENSGINELDKEKAKLNINESLLKKVNNEVKLISENSDSEKSNKKQLAYLKELNEELRNEIASSKAIIEKKVKEAPENENSVESILANYTSKSYEINELQSDAEKIEAIERLNDLAIEAVEKEIKTTKIANAANPREELQYEIEKLENIKKELESNKSKDYYGVVDLSTDEDLATIKGGTNIYEIEPDYQLKLESIFEDAISEKDQERKKIELNEEALAKTNQEIRRVENGLTSEPDNKKQLNKRLESLSEIKLILEDKIFESKSIIGEGGVMFNVVVDVEDVNPDYLSRVEGIKNLSDSKEKKKAVVELNRETIDQIEQKMTILDEDLRKNGLDKKKIILFQKYGQLVAEIEANPSIPVKGSISSSAINTNITENVEFPVIYKNVGINEALPSYKSELDSINSIVQPPVDNQKSKISLYNASIENIERQIKELDTYSRIDSPNKEYAEEKKGDLIEIIEVLKKEKIASEEKITELTSPIEFASLSDIMPDYDTRMEKINYENNGTIDKLEKTNELNKVLLFEIDTKIEELETLQEVNESQTRQENIEKLNELSVAINQELINTSNVLKVSGEEADITAINENKFEPLNPDHFEDNLEVNQLNLIKKDVKLIMKFEKDISRLTRKKARLTGGDANKVQKEIDKTIQKQSTLHNRLISDLEVVIDEKLWVELSEAKESAILIKGANMKSDDIRNAEEGIIISEAKIERAKAYRKEASELKNQVVSNKILLKAAQLEYEAQQLLVKSNLTLKTAAIVSELTNTAPVIIDVPTIKKDRVSEELFKLADEIDGQADIAEAKVMALADSVLRSKKKYREAIVVEMEQTKQEEANLRLKADALRFKAGEVEDQELEFISAKPSGNGKDIPKTDQIVALKSPTYSKYFSEITLGNESLEKANKINDEINLLKEKAGKIIREAIVVNPEMTLEDHESSLEMKTILEQIDELVEQQKNHKTDAISYFNSANETLNNSQDSKNLKENIILLAERNIQPDAKIVLSQEDVENTAIAGVIESTASNTNDIDSSENTDISQLNDNTVETLVSNISETSSDFVTPSKLNGQLFRITERAVYSNDNPIPLNAKQPEGLVYKVQVGAFRKPLPPQTFNKFAPISGQVINSGVTRYMVGYFTNFSPADIAKSEIRGIGGYGDAFVVAYYNGERISINRARELETEGVIPGNVAANNAVEVPNTDQNNLEPAEIIDNTVKPIAENVEPTVPDNQIVEPTGIDQKNVIKPVTNEDKEKIDYYTSVNNAAPASQVEIINGLFYTVQIGVYSKPVPSVELFEVTPLNSQLTKSGKIRYSTGIYTEIQNAVQRKNELVEVGIVDAFVTAYFNGNRISITESKEIISKQGADILSNGKTISEANGGKSSRFSKENVYYRILLGKYENVVPSNVASYLFNDDNIFFETEIDADNTIYLYTQKFFDLNEVRKRLVEINELGFDNMEIISYYNIQTIPFNQAKRIVNGEEISELTEFDYPHGSNVDEIFYEADAIYYRVNISKEDEVSLASIENQLLNIEGLNFEQETLENGDILIHTRNLSSFVEAEAALSEIDKNGIANAKIVAFHKYVQISVEKAIEIKEK
ncbi:MAG: hypothetical protein AB8B74_09390 [Crocinitomicaceae bacterium]